MPQVVAAVVICLFLAFASPANAQARYALLIGNQAYASQLGPLKNPVNDVALIAEALVRVGFKRRNIRIVRNADRVSLLSAVDDYVAELRTAGEGAVGFFYYSGHGVASKRDKRNYLIPIGVERLDRKVWYKSVALDDVISRLSGSAPNAAHFVIFDACRNHLRLPTKGSKGFVPTRTRRGMLIAFSTDPGETASDEGDSSGPYASALASELTRRGQNHLDLFQNVKERVYRTTGIQVPWTRDGMLQRVYLAGRTTSQSASIASNKQQAAPPISRAAKEWAEIQHTQSVAVLENFAQKFKDSVFATFAMARVRELQEVRLAKLSSADPNYPFDGVWQIILNPKTCKSFRSGSHIGRIHIRNHRGLYGWKGWATVTASGILRCLDGTEWLGFRATCRGNRDTSRWALRCATPSIAPMGQAGNLRRGSVEGLTDWVASHSSWRFPRHSS